MGKVYRNKREIAIPNFAYVDKSNAKVFIYTTDPGGKKHRKAIGYATSENAMQPNETFRSLYPDLWKEAYPNDKVMLHELSIGMYALTLGVGACSGLYQILQEVYGPQHGNAIMDYSMFSIMYRSCTTQIYSDTMEREVVFSDRVYSDSWYSALFKELVTEDQHHQLRIKWIQNCVRRGMKKVWLGIDGSNNDCDVTNSTFPEFGHPKSHNENKKVVGYMYAVDASSGCPVTYFPSEGSVADVKAFQKIASFLCGFDMGVEGVILDRAFATEDVLSAIDSLKWKYVIMLPGDTYGHQKMQDAYSDEIRWNSKHVVSDDGVFGISDRVRLFGNHERVSQVSLFFDGAGSSQQSVRLIKKVNAEKRRLEEAISLGKKAAVAKGCQKYLSIDKSSGKRLVVCDYDKWNLAMSGKGYYSMATSDGLEPADALSIYKLRDASETQYGILKSQEGCNTTRVHTTAGIRSKMAVSFISSIIRTEIMNACQKLGLDTNPFIQKLDRIVLILLPDGSYHEVRNLTRQQADLLGCFGVSQDDFSYFAREVNHRMTSAINSPVHMLPPKGSVPVKNNKRKPGRPPGSKNRKTLELEQAKAIEVSMPVETKVSEPIKKKAGRPLGKKDSKPRKQRSDKGKPRNKID